jgi:hypothetical protein
LKKLYPVVKTVGHAVVGRAVTLWTICIRLIGAGRTRRVARVARRNYVEDDRTFGWRGRRVWAGTC